MRQHVQAPDGRNELDFENDSNRIIADSADCYASSRPARCGPDVGTRNLRELTYERTMNQGSNPPSGQPGGGKGRRRRRGRRGPATQGAHPQGQGQVAAPQRRRASTVTAKHARATARDNGPGQSQPGGGIYTAPMDHSYRAAQNDNNNGNQQTAKPRSRRPGFRQAVLCLSSRSRCR